MPDQLTSPSQRATRRRRTPAIRQTPAPAVRNNPARDTHVGPNLDTLPMPQIPGIAHSHVQVDDGCRLHVAQAGTGPALILIHGWPQHWYAWREIIAPLADHFRVICLDVRGLGWSDSVGEDWSLQRLAHDVVGVMDALDIGGAGVIGHDWGAAIAYRTAIDHPDRVSRLMPLGGLHPWTTIGLHPRNIWRPWHVYTAATLGRHNNTWLGIPRIALRTWRRTGAFTPVDSEIYCSAMRQPHALLATTLYYRNFLTREVLNFQRNANRIHLDLPILHINGANDPLTQQLSAAYRDHAPNMALHNPSDLPTLQHHRAWSRFASDWKREIAIASWVGRIVMSRESLCRRRTERNASSSSKSTRHLAVGGR